jgi:enoyl-CoA hydratase
MGDVDRSTPRPGIAQLTLNRPDVLNAMTADLVESLHQHLDDVATDPSVRVVVLTGAGRGFCAGLDLGGYGEAPHTSSLGPTQRGFAVQKHIASLVPHLRGSTRRSSASACRRATSGRRGCSRASSAHPVRRS